MLFFGRFGKIGKWHVILCTDEKLDYRKMMELYQIRWSIEVFFKEAKQYQNLRKSQSEDFGGQITDLNVSLIQHILLTLTK
jgi:IS4 transposase